MRKYIGLWILCALFSVSTFAQTAPKTIKVVCIGNSITYGSGVKNRDKDSYPAVLSQMLGKDYEVKNFGIGSRTLLNKGDFPYMKEQMFQDALNYLPNIVVVKLGTNDSKPQNWKYKNEYKKDLETMVDAFQSIASKPKIYLCYPAKAYAVQWGINDSIITTDIIPFINEVAAKKKTEIIDLHTATSGVKEFFPDNVHPNEAGAILLAKEVYKSLTGKTAEHITQAFPGIKSEWNGGDRYDFTYKDRQVIVVAPKQAAKGNPWIWRPAFFDAFPSVDIALVAKGFHVVYYDLTNLYGSPRAVGFGTDFYNYMTTNYGLSNKVTLEGFSRGGLFAFNWATRNTEKVACIYVDAPVCDVFSWPSRKQRGLWNELLKEWNLTDEQMANFKGNPIDNLAPLAKAGIPVFSVCGGSDKTVPYNENMEVVRSRYLALGGPVEVIVKEGVDHHPHSLDNPEPVVDFILRHQSGYTTQNHFTIRGSLQNSLIKFEKEKNGRVAFLGGSITEMVGWRTLIQTQLKQRFPNTTFEFVDAGISSTGTTPGAFRFENDVLSKGKVDLLFVEAAVNDDTNGFTPAQQVRGMEGEIRHALISNPDMDIIMLHFVYDPFLKMMAGGRVPDVILNHERVANQYLIPSINLAQEIAERMNAGEFDWKTFGGTHPLPFGHKYYAAAINRLWDIMWSKASPEGNITPHNIPEKPLDEFSYYGGRFLDIKLARIDKGWNYVPNWKPTREARTRGGFVNVPMLEATQPGAQLTLNFRGKAIGIFGAFGPASAILEYSIDGAPIKKLNTNTAWSGALYIPWVHMLECELKDTDHVLVLRISKETKSKGTECEIRNFVVNTDKP